ncbi:MAG: hypothetical protein IPK93_09600 [Solirubrobacterales bacterium]|nr:hypothetical protein [Solirubrobacterales bacterium]
MSDPLPDKNSDRIPRGAIAVVIVGLFLTVAVIVLNLRGQDPSTKLDWVTTEEVKSPPATDFGGKGEFRLNRTTLAAIPPNGAGDLIYRVSGDVVIDSAGKKPTSIKCKFSAPGADTTVAKTRGDLAAWPRPSKDLLIHEVPEALVVKFRAAGNTVLEMPIRDSIRRYTNSASPTQTDWVRKPENRLRPQVLTWSMPVGTGRAAASATPLCSKHRSSQDRHHLQGEGRLTNSHPEGQGHPGGMADSGGCHRRHQRRSLPRRGVVLVFVRHEEVGTFFGSTDLVQLLVRRLHGDSSRFERLAE